MMNTTIKGLHFVTGEKGGVGKSLWSMVLLEYLQAEQISYLFFDTDRTALDVGSIYEPDRYGVPSPPSKAEYPSLEEKEQNTLNLLPDIYFSDYRTEVFSADQLIDLALEHLVIVNLPAQVNLTLNRWFDQGNLSLAKDEGVDLTFWFVTDGSPVSLNLLHQSLQNYQGDIHHLVVLNEGLSEDVRQLVASHPVAQSIHDYALECVTLPLLFLSDQDKKMLNERRIRLSQASDRSFNCPLTLIAKQRVKNFLRQTHLEIEKLGLFKALNPA